jgi:Putative transposase
MTLPPDEFIRRFLLHVLPKGFHRIRHYGLLASAACKANIALVRELIAGPAPVIDPPAGRDNRRRPSPAMSLLRRPHNHRRHPWARGAPRGRHVAPLATGPCRVPPTRTRGRHDGCRYKAFLVFHQRQMFLIEIIERCLQYIIANAVNAENEGRLEGIERGCACADSNNR